MLSLHVGNVLPPTFVSQFSNSLFKIQTSSQLKCCVRTLRELFIRKCPKTSINRSIDVTRNKLLNYRRYIFPL